MMGANTGYDVLPKKVFGISRISGGACPSLRFFAWSEGPQSLMLCFVTLIAIQNTLIRFIGNSARSTRFIGTIWLPGAGSVPESSEFPVFFPDTRETRPRDRFAADCLLRQLGYFPSPQNLLAENCGVPRQSGTFCTEPNHHTGTLIPKDDASGFTSPIATCVVRFSDAVKCGGSLGAFDSELRSSLDRLPYGWLLPRVACRH